MLQMPPPPRTTHRTVAAIPKLLSPLNLPPPALPDNLYAEDREKGHAEIWQVVQSRAQQWVDNLYLGNDFKPDILIKQRRAANVASKEKTRQVLEDSQSTRKRKYKSGDHDAKIQETFYWAVIDPENVSTTTAFIDAMAVDPRSRSRQEERIIDSYWTTGMSLDPILKMSRFGKTDQYLRLGHLFMKTKDWHDRGIEDGDLDGIYDEDEPVDYRPKKYRKMAATAKIVFNVNKPSYPQSPVHMKRSQDI